MQVGIVFHSLTQLHNSHFGYSAQVQQKIDTQSWSNSAGQAASREKKDGQCFGSEPFFRLKVEGRVLEVRIDETKQGWQQMTKEALSP